MFFVCCLCFGSALFLGGDRIKNTDQSYVLWIEWFFVPNFVYYFRLHKNNTSVSSKGNGRIIKTDAFYL